MQYNILYIILLIKHLYYMYIKIIISLTNYNSLEKITEFPIILIKP